MDKIFIKNLNIETIIGIYSHEINTKQPLILDLELKIDAKKIAQSDNINNALDYDLVVDSIINLCNNHQFNLIETLAEFLAQNILENFNTQWIKLAITKPKAMTHTREVGVVIERGNITN